MRVVADAAGVVSAVTDEQYTVTAVMVERECCGQAETLLVELLEDHLRSDQRRWTAIAYDPGQQAADRLGDHQDSHLATEQHVVDELDQRQAEPSRGRTAPDAVRGIDWCHLFDTTA